MAQWDEREPGDSGLNGDGGARPEPGAVAQDRQAQLEHAIENARAELDHYVEAAAQFIRDRPVACLAGALALGYLVGKLASRR